MTTTDGSIDHDKIATAIATEATGDLTEKTATSDGDVERGTSDEVEVVKQKKPFSFYMAFTCLLIMIFLAALDSTCMSVSISVSPIRI